MWWPKHNEMYNYKIRNPNIEIRNKSELQNVPMTETKQTMPYKLFCLNHLNFCHLILFRVSDLRLTP